MIMVILIVMMKIMVSGSCTIELQSTVCKQKRESAARRHVYHLFAQDRKQNVKVWREKDGKGEGA